MGIMGFMGVLIRGLIEWKKRDSIEKGGIKERMYRSRKDWQSKNGINGASGVYGQMPPHPIKPTKPNNLKI